MRYIQFKAEYVILTDAFFYVSCISNHIIILNINETLLFSLRDRDSMSVNGYMERRKLIQHYRQKKFSKRENVQICDKN